MPPAHPKRFARRVTGLLATALAIIWLSGLTPAPTLAAATLVQTAHNSSTSGTSISTSLTSAAAGDLLVVICAANASSTITGPSGFSTAINQAGTVSQAIFYKIAAGGETSESCNLSGNNTMAIQAYEYSGVHAYTTLDGTASASGNSTTISTGTLATTHADDLLLAAAISNTNAGTIGSWTNSFTSENNFSITSGPKGNRAAFAGADFAATSTGSYSATASTPSAAWSGQIVAFRVMAASPTLNADIVDASGNPVANPSVSVTSLVHSFACQTATGTLGTSSQKMRVTNTSDSPAWSLTLAASGGPTSVWTNGTTNYSFNNPAGNPAGCSGGQLSVNPSLGTITPSTGCSASGVNLGASSAFASGATDAVTIASASSPAAIDCTWDITGVGLSQKVPPNQANGNYSINLTLTLTAS